MHKLFLYIIYRLEVRIITIIFYYLFSTNEIRIRIVHSTSIFWQFQIFNKSNNLIFKPDKKTCTIFTLDPAEYNTRQNLKFNNTTLDMHKHLKILSLILHPKTHINKHIDNMAAQASKTLPILKIFSLTKWCTHKETLPSTYKDITKTNTRVCPHYMITYNINSLRSSDAIYHR